MRLATERPFHSGDDLAKDGWVRRILQSVEERVAFLGGEVELAGSPVGNVNGDDKVEFLAVGLDGY